LAAAPGSGGGGYRKGELIPGRNLGEELAREDLGWGGKERKRPRRAAAEVDSPSPAWLRTWALKAWFSPPPVKRQREATGGNEHRVRV
jgi:hypothetical protein